MNPVGYALFDTTIGRCGIAWSEAGVTRVVFPETTEAATRARVTRGQNDPGEAKPPAAIVSAIAAITELLASGRSDLTGIVVDMEASVAEDRPFLDAARGTPAGSTITYGELAARAGRPGAAREAGQAMARNRYPIIVPCHRVLAAGGGFGGFSAPGGVESKARLLTIERAAVGDAPSLFDDLPIAVRPRG
jgi:methylated-DNA-[protein]-cysteine S-methyltransferase